MQKPYTNTGTTPIYIGPHLVQPGDTRMVDESFMPPEGPAAASDAPADPVLDLLDYKVADIAAALSALSDEDLARLESAENAGKTRKGVLEAIGADKFRRAAAKTVIDPS